MNVGIVQFDVKKELNSNLSKIKDLIKNKKADIFLLPELCDIGYLFDSKEELLQKAYTIADNPILKYLLAESEEKKCAFIFGVAEKCDNRIYNSAVAVDSGNLIGMYRKQHLSDLEKTLFDSKKNNGVFDVQGIRIGVQICFDLWFPEVSREQILDGAQILFALANFGGENTLKIAEIRAMENLVPLVLANRTGRENGKIVAEFLGKSRVYDKDGSCISQLTESQEACQVTQVVINKEKSNVICKDFLSEIKKHYSK